MAIHVSSSLRSTNGVRLTCSYHHHHRRFVAVRALLVVVCLFLVLPTVRSRPVVRNIQSTHEFDRLLKKHATETGLPVVVDFYSDSCGPCRMMAPIFKTVAASYLDQAVFVKIDTNRQAELSSRYQVRSLPTFAYFSNGQKVDQAVGGIGEAALRQQTDALVRTADLENTRLTRDALTAFYQQYDNVDNVDDDKEGTKKTAADIDTVYQKCVAMTKKGGVSTNECVGAAANQLARRLRKKYGQAPPLERRFAATAEPESTSSSAGGSPTNDATTKKSHTKSSSSSTSGQTNSPNLHLASLDDLQAELERRQDELRDQTVDAEDADDDEADPVFRRWNGPGDFPEALVIVGGGPAGLAAAIYGARAGLRPLIIAPSMGGQLQGKGVEVENYPGLFNQTGPSVVAAMRLQAAIFGAVFEDDVVQSVVIHHTTDDGGTSSPKPISIVTNNTGTIQTHALIVATGAEANWLGVAGEWELRGGGVSSCAVCDGFLYAQRHVIVVGGGDAAMEDALVLARTSRSVTVVHRRDQFRASKVLADRVLNHPLITVVWNAVVQEILGSSSTATVDSASSNSEDDEETVDMDDLPAAAVDVDNVVSGVILKDIVTGVTRQVPTDAVFVAIGHTPNTPFLQGVVDFDPAHPGYLWVGQGSTQTSAPGIFAAGDVSDAVYRQAITSAGSGAAAALDAERYLSEHGLGNEAAELEAELMADLRLSQQQQQLDDVATTYNAYDDVGGKMKGMRESMTVEL